jgi:4-hydroxybenzoate polyprenyltransferase
MLKQIFNAIRIQDKSKNILIFLPIFFDTNINSYQLIELFLGFILFFFLTNIIYIINDFSDIEKDKINKLKKYKINKLLNIIILAFSVLSLIFLYFYKNELFNIYVYFYVIIFIFYNYLFKKLKYLDVVFLSFFYLIRIYYGFELYQELEISLGFTIFFLFLFIHLAFIKRYIQVCVNNFDTSQKIIPYNTRDIPKIKKVNHLLSVLNLIIIFLYFLDNYYIDMPKLFLLDSEYKSIEIVSFLIFFIFFIFKTNQIFKNELKKDIMSIYLFDIKFISSFFLLIAIFLFF